VPGSAGLRAGAQVPRTRRRFCTVSLKRWSSSLASSWRSDCPRAKYWNAPPTRSRVTRSPRLRRLSLKRRLIMHLAETRQAKEPGEHRSERTQTYVSEERSPAKRAQPATYGWRVSVRGAWRDSVADAAYGLDQLPVLVAELLPQVTHVDLDV